MQHVATTTKPLSQIFGVRYVNPFLPLVSVMGLIVNKKALMSLLIANIQVRLVSL